MEQGRGRCLHQLSGVPDFGLTGRGLRLREGIAFAMESMVDAGGHAVKTLADKWIVVMVDSSLSAHGGG